MLQLIVFIIFLISLAGVIFILARKTTQLVELPQNGHHGFKKVEFIVKFEKRLKDAYFHFFEKQMLLHKLLSKFRLVTLKVERVVDELLHGIRKKAQELDQKTKTKKKKK